MQKKKTLKELTLKDNFLFGAVMSDEENCRELLELILEFPVERIEVSKERSITYHPGYKGVRLDVYAKDASHTRYNVEMQAVADRAIGKRARYYHSQVDMDALKTGTSYAELPNVYVIFICDFDPFGEGKYRYTFENRCLESEEARIEDGYVKKLQKSIAHIKESREMEERYMLLDIIIQEERAKGKAEALFEFLEELGPVPEELRCKIEKEKNLNTLGEWIKLAVRAESLEAFTKEM